LREIPNCALDLIQEVFDPSYAVFYKCVRNSLVAVAVRGPSEYALGHRLELGQGIVGWSALKQLALTPEEIRFESGIVRGRNLSEGMPEEGFSMCLPVVRGSQTIGVILVGPCKRVLTRALDLGRTIALMTSVAVTSAVVFKEQARLAQTDGLTGLLNKTRILRHVRTAIASEESACRTLSIFLFDIDHFKHYNDTNGHLAGDEVLKSLGRLLESSLREGEFVGRYGGEEFLMVLSDVGKSEALKAAERIRAAIAEHDFSHADQQPLGRVSISGGVASWPTDGSDSESLIRCADHALYQAKREGRNRVLAYYPPELRGDQEFDLAQELELEATEDHAKEPQVKAWEQLGLDSSSLDGASENEGPDESREVRSSPTAESCEEG
jgi:diguanylate cyclase (GGDEF)-like protein